jgi:L-malate glycosyltransferase
MKILLIDNSLDQTGASKALLQTIEEMPHSEFEFIFLFPKKSKCVEVVIAEGYQAYNMGFIEISKRIKDLVAYFPNLILNARAINKLVKKENISIVHVNDIYNMTGIVAKLFSGIKLITHVRRMPESFPDSIYRIWSKLHIRYADRIVAVSEANKNGLPPNNKTCVVYDPLPEEEKHGLYVAKSHLNKRASVLCLANFTNGKGHLYVLGLAKRFREEYPEWKINFNFYGGVFGLQTNINYKNSLIGAAEDMNIKDFVFFYDQTELIEEVMKMHDISLNLSDSESFSRVTLESLFFGIPTIATNVGGTNEMVLDKQTGILVNRGDINSMYEGFKSLILDDDLRQKISKNAHSYVRGKFGHVETVEKLANVYRSMK